MSLKGNEPQASLQVCNWPFAVEWSWACAHMIACVAGQVLVFALVAACLSSVKVQHEMQEAINAVATSPLSHLIGRSFYSRVELQSKFGGCS
eukprot:3331853-Amphidinium_carterae.1